MDYDGVPSFFGLGSEDGPVFNFLASTAGLDVRLAGPQAGG